MLKLNQAINELASTWLEAGIEAGDTVLLHSDIRRTLVNFRRQNIDITPKHILESFLLAVSSKGTLLLPLFNFEFPQTQYFDIKNTPSQMGALTEAGRQHPSAVRTGHPIYSFAAIGHKAGSFSNIDNVSGYGLDSPFALLRQLDGKIASLDLDDQNSMTFYHHIEEANGVSYRYFKEFSGNYIDRQGIASEKTYKLFVRDEAQNVQTNVNPAGELLWDSQLYKGDRPREGSGLRTIKANDMFQLISSIINNGAALGTLYSIGATAE